MEKFLIWLIIKTIPKIINNDNNNKNINNIDNINKNNNENYILAEIEVEEIGIKRILNSWEFALKYFSDFYYHGLLNWAKEKLEKLKH